MCRKLLFTDEGYDNLTFLILRQQDNKTYIANFMEVEDLLLKNKEKSLPKLEGTLLQAALIKIINGELTIEQLEITKHLLKLLDCEVMIQ